MTATARNTRRRNPVAAAPCAKCPFRKDVPVYLHASRREEIARSVADGHTFPCHATVDYDGPEDGDGGTAPDASGASECAGAAKATMLDGGSTQSMRIAERLGMADLARTAGTGADVWQLSEWTRLAMGATADDPVWDDVETCNTVDAGCLAPAGYLGSGGGVVSGTEAADSECAECGEPVCSQCADDAGRCGGCAEWDDEWDDGRA